MEMVGWLGKKSLNENNIFFNIAIYTMLLDNFFTLKCEVNKGMAQSGNGWMVRKTAGMARDKKKECWERDGGTNIYKRYEDIRYKYKYKNKYNTNTDSCLTLSLPSLLCIF